MGYVRGSYISVSQLQKGAGFYSAVFGSLPYAIGPESIETYSLYRIVR